MMSSPCPEVPPFPRVYRHTGEVRGTFFRFQAPSWGNLGGTLGEGGTCSHKGREGKPTVYG